MRPNIVFSNVSNDARVPRYDGHIWVPVDDEHTNVYNFMCGSDEACALEPDFVERIEAGYGRGEHDYIPGTFSLKANLENDYFIDRQMQKRATFTGIRGINTQDIALQEGMGAIVDRAREFLGTSDRAIVVMRKLLLEAANAVARGEAPRGSDAATFRDVRPYDAVLPAESDWRRYFADNACARW
jgi:phthalate 4,5-dioxygenase